jgi:hypothetical protein
MSEPPYRPDMEPWIAEDAIRWQPADMIATVGGRAPWKDLQSHGSLWLAVDCLGEESATVGELIAKNSTGPLRLGFGGWRDLLLGCQFRNGRGELITAGGRTVKNVAGYDVTKFMVGQAGVLGEIIAVNLRAYRKPADALLCEFEPNIEIFNRLIASPCRPQWGMLSEGALNCGYLGDVRTVDYYAKHLGEFAPRKMDRQGFAADVRWRCGRWKGGSMRASVPPVRIGEFCRMANLKDWVADPAFGIVLADAERLAATHAAAVGGRAWFYNEGRELSEFSAGREERDVLQKLKHSFDPDNRLLPLP